MFKLRLFIFKPALAFNLGLLLLASYFQSRSFVIGYTMSIAFLLCAFQKFKISRKQIAAGIFGLVILVTFLSIYFKPDSSLGRLLVYKLCFKILKNNYLWGIGWNKFALVYGEYQIAYFRNGMYTIKELLLADNTKHAFNDYLQFFIEGGVKGLMILILLITFITSSTSTSLKRNINYPIPLLLAITQIIAIGFAALFMHVFEKPWYQVMFISSIIVIIYYAYFNKKNIYTCLLVILIVSGSTAYIHYGNYLKNYTHYKEWANAQESYGTGYITEAYLNYKTLYSFLKEDIEFLNQYATVLTTLNKHAEALHVTRIIVSKDNANIFLQRLGDCYFLNKNFEKAEEAYLRSIYRVPNRFGTRFSLFNFYRQTEQLTKAKTVGKSIMQLPVKVPSFQIEHIKHEVSNFMCHTSKKKLLIP